MGNFWQHKDEMERRQRRIKRMNPAQCFHWLAVATDTNLRTMRDLRGCHLPMLQSLYSLTCQRIQEETGVDSGQIMAYVHYPPSVYQLHVHFKHLAGPGVFHDTLRVHSLPTIINNLKIDSEYYAKSSLQLPVYVHTDLYMALGLDPTEIQKPGSNLPKSVELQTLQTLQTPLQTLQTFQAPLQTPQTPLQTLQTFQAPLQTPQTPLQTLQTFQTPLQPLPIVQTQAVNSIIISS